MSAFTNSTTELMLFDTKTTHWSSLVKGEGFGDNLWSHDGKYVYMGKAPRVLPGWFASESGTARWKRFSV